MSLLEALVCLVNSKLQSKIDWYKWPIKTAALPEGVVIPAGSMRQRNIALKHELHRLWLGSDSDSRMELARYYVKTWGGIKRNDETTLFEYVNADASAVVARATSGIASWSKVLCIRDPKKYAIFDARVSASLNCLQISNRVETPAMYPCLSTQNGDVRSGNRKIRAYVNNNNWPRQNARTFYEGYIRLIGDVAVSCGVCIQTVEMVLFTAAPDLIEGLREYGSGVCQDR
jgi:hypothetical protein